MHVLYNFQNLIYITFRIMAHVRSSDGNRHNNIKTETFCISLCCNFSFLDRLIAQPSRDGTGKIYGYIFLYILSSETLVLNNVRYVMLTTFMICIYLNTFHFDTNGGNAQQPFPVFNVNNLVHFTSLFFLQDVNLGI